MANKSASMTLSLSYVDGTGAARSVPSMSVASPYQGQEPEQLLDVPAGATAGVTYTVAFGTIGTEATNVVVKNGCSVPITLFPNGATVHGVPLAAGGVFAVAGATSATAATGGALTSLACVLGATQSTAATISAWVFGDPT